MHKIDFKGLFLLNGLILNWYQCIVMLYNKCFTLSGTYSNLYNHPKIITEPHTVSIIKVRKLHTKYVLFFHFSFTDIV